MEVGHERGRFKSRNVPFAGTIQLHNSGKGTEPAGVSQGPQQGGDHRAPLNLLSWKNTKRTSSAIDKLLECIS